MQDPGGEEETEDEAGHDPEKVTAEEALAELGDMLIDVVKDCDCHFSYFLRYLLFFSTLISFSS